MKKDILVFSMYYLPSIKAGGPVRSLSNMVDNLSDKFNFHIITLNRDVSDSKAFQEIETDVWYNVGKAKVKYLSKAQLNVWKICSESKEINPDFVYINSVFTIRYSINQILLKSMNLIKGKLIIAPRGEFSKGALRLKALPKRLYILLIKVFRINRNIFWHATSLSEKKDIQRELGENSMVKVASNLTTNYSDFKYQIKPVKQPGELKIVFVSRIHPIKNLLSAIRYLGGIKGQVALSIYGPIEDKAYWDRCSEEIAGLNENIIVEYMGAMQWDRIQDAYRQNHIFLFPTLGENFGHAIIEALINGCPVIISNQTPWRNLEKEGVGFDLPLVDDHAFIRALQYYVDTDNAAFKQHSKAAFAYAKKATETSKNIEATLALFN